MRILVAEHDHAERQAMVAALHNWGYETAETTSVRETVKSVSKGDIAIALVRSTLPEMDLSEFCRAVRENEDDHYTYLILYGTRGSRLDLLKGVNAGADDYILLPMDWHELQVHLQAGSRIANLHKNLVETQQRLTMMAKQDSLTGIWNRRGVLDVLDREHERHVRAGSGLGVLMVDADHFKDVNDTYGHPVGDEVLRTVSGRMASAVRPYDTIGRYGGEEFLVVLPGCDSKGALSTGERLRQEVAREPVSLGDLEVDVTVSIGVAAMDEMPDANPSDLVDIADRALYRAKQTGRNRVSSLTVPGTEAPFRQDLKPRRVAL
jgi:diguanylate cyclase (GGDEF)-like protein